MYSEITLNINGEEYSSAARTEQVDYGTSADFVAKAIAAGYRFNGYFTEATGGVQVYTAEGALIKGLSGYTDAQGNWLKDDADTNLYAQWTVRNTRGVTGFVGAGNKATPLSETDFANVFNPEPTVQTDIHVGDEVRILAGLFENFTGRVTEIDEEAQRVKVVVPMLKRETDVELAYDEVIKDE
jgi:transcriptional antiterminator NusG